MAQSRTSQLHLEHRPSGFYWRRRLPIRNGIDLLTKKRFRVFSLRTTSLRDAETLAARLTRISDQIFAAMTEKTMPIAADIADRLLTDLARFELECFERTRAVAPQRSAEAAAFELQREAALQETLRQAILLRDREICRQPLRHVAAELGIELDEEDPDWLSLAIRAMHVLIDISEERVRRDQGIYDGPSPIFRSAMAQMRGEAAVRRPAGAVPQNGTVTIDPQLASGLFAAGRSPASATEPAPTPTSLRPAPPLYENKAAPVAAVKNGASTGDLRVASVVQSEEDQRTAAAAAEEAVLAARIAARPPKITVNPEYLHENARRILGKQRGITLKEAFELYVSVKTAGYGENFCKRQKRHKEAGVSWVKSSGSKLDVASRLWIDLLGDQPFESISETAVEDALDTIWRVPRDHGKTEELKATDGYRELIERVDAREIECAAARSMQVSQNPGHTNADLEAAQHSATVPRLRVDTYLKHCRVPNAIGKMLHAMQLIDTNPFEICSWTAAEVDKLKRSQDCRARTSWDDRINTLFASSVYQGETKEPGEPLFWAPLIARHQGLRMEECLQLGPKDFGSESGIAYMTIRNIEGNSVKSEAGERRMPIHPNLIELGILQLVNLRRQQSQSRLFPELTRGATKKTFTENFTKAFGYYRKSQDCYWRGLDFHAFRTTFHGDLLNQDRSDAIRRRLMGHAPQDEGEKAYAQGLKMAPLLERLREVDVDISMIVSPFEVPRSTTQMADRPGRYLRAV
ncbi:DUF6538 domain-containing protein [Thioclava sp.]|uniref:DUF6538 domain-containing protein n=1 Tax=Thioclava sp. TaxID=1933450 RepID=UPI003AA7D1BC